MKRIWKKRLCYVITAAVLVTVIPGGREEVVFAGDSYQAAIDKAKEEKEALEKLRKETEERIAALEADKKSTEEYIRRVDEELSLAYGKMEELNQSIAECEEALKEAGEELEEAIKTKDNQYATMKARIKYMYENGDTSFWELLTGSKSLEDLLNQVEYRSRIAEYDDNLFKRYETSCELVREKEEAYEVRLVELNVEKEKQQLQIDNLSTLVANKAAYVDQLAES